MDISDATLAHALNIYRNPSWYTQQEVEIAMERFLQKAESVDTDSQADEWNALAEALLVRLTRF